MTKIITLLRRAGISDGLITLLNILGVSIFLLVERAWTPPIFLRYLLYALTLEGLVMALIGCLSFFGFEKYRREIKAYRRWSRGEANSEEEHKSAETKSENETKPGMGLVLLASGLLLFISAFVLLSLEF
jgi:hypothetical protein